MGIECGALPTEKGSVEGFQTGCDIASSNIWSRVLYTGGQS